MENNTQQETYRWVKASERVPVKNDLYHTNILWKDCDEADKFPNVTNYFVNQGWELDDNYEVVEWLEQLPSTPQISDEDIERMATEFYPDNMGGIEQKGVLRYRAGYKKGYKDALKTQTVDSTWLTEKPEFTEECILLVGRKYRNNVDWEYQSFEIKKLDGEDEEGNPAWYWGICCLDGEEWGDLADLKADRYKIISPITPPQVKPEQ